MAKDLLAHVLPDQQFVLKQVLHESPDCAAMFFDDRTRRRQLFVKRKTAQAPGIEAAKTLMQAQLSCVAPILGVHEDQRTQLVVYGFLAGGNLSQRLDKQWSLKQVISLCIHILSALEATHRLGVCHGNLRPENILFDAKGRLKLADFGCTTHHNYATEGMAIRYPGEAATHQADLFALGVIAYRLITGENPHFIAGMLHAHEAFDTLPEPLRKSFEGLLNPEPKQRFSTAREALASLKVHQTRPVKRFGGVERAGHFWRKFRPESKSDQASPKRRTKDALGADQKKQGFRWPTYLMFLLFVLLVLGLLAALMYDDLPQVADFNWF